MIQSTKKSRQTTLLLAVYATLGLGAVAPLGVLAADDNQFPAHTVPVEKRDQNFDLPGVVDKVLVKEGDVVKAGQLLAEENVTGDQAHLDSLKLLASSELEVKAEEAQLAKDKVDLVRKEELIKQNAISHSEYEEAVVNAVIDQLKVDHAKDDKIKAQYDVKEQEAKIQQKRITARIDGVISQIATHEGELADTQHPAITIVKNDVLYVEVDLPADVVNRLKKAGSKAPLQVRYVDEGEKAVWRDASIHFIKPEADAQSNFEHVQLEMPNPEVRSAGLQVVVRLPANIVASAADAAPALNH